MISAAENSNKFQKTRFWKEKSIEDVVALGPKAKATRVNWLVIVHRRTLWSRHTSVAFGVQDEL
jgi:hypothetical protein